MHVAPRWMIGGSLLLISLTAGIGWTAEPGESSLPLVLEEDFENGADRWEPSDPAAWEVVQDAKNRVFRQGKASKFEPPHRSPFNIALLKDVVVGDCDLIARVRSTKEDYPHRDACLVFGYQDPAHFYYVHFGKRADDHANQIFIVNGAPRTKISRTSTPGTNWDDEWHTVKVSRRPEQGTIEIYFDDMTTPAMTAEDKTFGAGRIGIGTFDDTADYDDVRLYGVKGEPGAKPTARTGGRRAF